MPVQLTEQEFRLFSEWISETYGLRFGPEKRDILRARLEPRRLELNFDTFEQLYFHLKFHPEREAERLRLVPHLTNNESYFFRESAQLDVLRNGVLRDARDRAARQGRNEVRILSAACASGEEAYSLAIVALESGLFSGSRRAVITGVDLDPDALQRAQTGVYTDNAFRRLGGGIRERYFREVKPQRWELDAKVRKMVQFRRANLIDEGWSAGLPPQDIIFCRNVLIYFNDENTERAVRGLYNALAPCGHLFLGHAEGLSRIPTRFVPVRRPGAVFYRRPEADDA